MDIPRESNKKRTIVRRTIYIVFSIVVICGITAWLSQLEQAAPSVERATVYIDEVKRGDMLREVRGPGTLVPIDIRWISPSTSGRVEKIPILPGTSVTEETVIVELSNPQVELDAQSAKLNIKSAESKYAAMKVQLENDLLNLETAAARVDANFAEAELKAKSETELAKDGLISELQLKVSTVRGEELEKLKAIEKRRVKVQREYAKTQLEVLQAEIEQAKALHALKKEQVDSLQVRAGFNGVLEQRLVEVGQQVAPSVNLAKVSDPTHLKAVLQIDQNQVREVIAGQPVRIDIRSSVLKGHVERIDPAVQQGTVEVDVALDDPLPNGARPDQRLDGTIEIEKLTGVLYTGRPYFGQPNSVISLFRLNAERDEATRIQVRLGQNSVSTVEIIQGLEEGDRVILTDMSDWDDTDRIRLR